MLKQASAASQAAIAKVRQRLQQPLERKDQFPVYPVEALTEVEKVN